MLLTLEKKSLSPQQSRTWGKVLINVVGGITAMNALTIAVWFEEKLETLKECQVPTKAALKCFASQSTIRLQVKNLFPKRLLKGKREIRINKICMNFLKRRGYLRFVSVNISLTMSVGFKSAFKLCLRQVVSLSIHQPFGGSLVPSECRYLLVVQTCAEAEACLHL